MRVATRGGWLIAFNNASRKGHIIPVYNDGEALCKKERGQVTLMGIEEKDIATFLAMPNGCAWCRNAWNVISRARSQAGEP